MKKLSEVASGWERHIPCLDCPHQSVAALDLVVYANIVYDKRVRQDGFKQLETGSRRIAPVTITLGGNQEELLCVRGQVADMLGVCSADYLTVLCRKHLPENHDKKKENRLSGK